MMCDHLNLSDEKMGGCFGFFWWMVLLYTFGHLEVIRNHEMLGGAFKYFFMFTPILGED